MAPGSPQHTHFEHFRALASKCLQEAPRRLILNNFVPWPPNRLWRLPEARFDHCRALATKITPRALFGRRRKESNLQPSCLGLHCRAWMGEVGWNGAFWAGPLPTEQSGALSGPNWPPPANPDYVRPWPDCAMKSLVSAEQQRQGCIA